MKINNPTIDLITSTQGLLRWAQSVYKSMTHALGIAQPLSQDSTGVYNTFVQDNLDCTLIYIGANGSGAVITWAASNVGQTINHKLLRQPIGFFPVYKTKACDVYATATPTKDNLTVACTDATAKVILAVF